MSEWWTNNFCRTLTRTPNLNELGRNLNRDPDLKVEVPLVGLLPWLNNCTIRPFAVIGLTVRVPQLSDHHDDYYRWCNSGPQYCGIN